MDRSKIVIIILGVLIIFFLGFTTIQLLNKSSKEKSLSQNKNLNTTKPFQNTPSQTLKDYLDSSGFSFSYPDDVSLEKKLNVDKSIYAELMMTSKTAKGKISITISDTVLNSVSSWMNEQKDPLYLHSGIPSKFANLDAIEFRTASKIATVAIDKGILFLIEADSPNDIFYWESVYKKVLSSFTFVAPTSVPVASEGNDSSSVVFEGEEVVE